MKHIEIKKLTKLVFLCKYICMNLIIWCIQAIALPIFPLNNKNIQCTLMLLWLGYFNETHSELRFLLWVSHPCYPLFFFSPHSLVCQCVNIWRAQPFTLQISERWLAHAAPTLHFLRSCHFAVFKCSSNAPTLQHRGCSHFLFCALFLLNKINKHARRCAC